MRININKDLVSPPAILRGNWKVKVSSYKGTQLLLIAIHIEKGSFIMKMFNSDASASDFINSIVDEDIV